MGIELALKYSYYKINIVVSIIQQKIEIADFNIFKTQQSLSEGKTKLSMTIFFA